MECVWESGVELAKFPHLHSSTSAICGSFAKNLSTIYFFADNSDGILNLRGVVRPLVWQKNGKYIGAENFSCPAARGVPRGPSHDCPIINLEGCSFSATTVSI